MKTVLNYVTWNILSLCYTVIDIVVGTGKSLLGHNSKGLSKHKITIAIFQKFRKQYILR